MRSTFILIIIALTTQAWAQKADPCSFEATVELRLEADEFSIPVYDAQRGLMVVQLSHELMPNLDRARSVRLDMPRPEVVLPIIPASVSLGLEKGLRNLQLVVEAEPMNRAPSPIDIRPNCQDLKLRAIRLENDSVVLGRQQVLEAKAKGRPTLKVEHGIRMTAGQANTSVVNDVVTALARRCLERSLSDQSRINGALSIRLARSLLGDAEKPTIVVDGLINHEIGHCLISSLEDAAPLWGAIEPASILFLDLYLRGEADPQVEPVIHHVEADRSFH